MTTRPTTATNKESDEDVLDDNEVYDGIATAADNNDCGEVDDKEEAVKAAAVRVFLKLKCGVTVLRVR